MRSNLVSLQGTVDLLNRTQERLSTGKKVNTALDNPLNYFTAKALNSRASDLAAYKDGMSEAVQTIKAANTGISAIEGLLAQAKAVAATAKAGVAGGAGTWSNVSVDLEGSLASGQTITAGTKTFTAVSTDVQQTITFATVTAGTQIVLNGVTYTATSAATAALTSSDNYFSMAGADDADANDFLAKINTRLGYTAGATTAGVIYLNLATSGLGAVTSSQTGAIVGTVVAHLGTTASSTGISGDEFYIGGSDTQDISNLAAKINAAGELKASVNDTHINILSGTVTLTSNTVTSAATGFTVEAFQATSDRASYAEQFNSIMNQLDLVATDSGYKGINFLAKDNTLDVEFGATSSDKITLNGFDASAAALLAKASGLETAENDWATNADVDVDIAGLAAATATLKTKSSDLSSGLSIINTRQDWVKGMVNTLTEGSDKLTLADMNEEGANMLMLQTRQSLGTTALSLSAQAAQSVLRLFA